MLAVVVFPVHPLKTQKHLSRTPPFQYAYIGQLLQGATRAAMIHGVSSVACTVDQYTVSMHASVFYESTGAGVGGGRVSDIRVNYALVNQ